MNAIFKNKYLKFKTKETLFLRALIQHKGSTCSENTLFSLVWYKFFVF